MDGLPIRLARRVDGVSIGGWASPSYVVVNGYQRSAIAIVWLVFAVLTAATLVMWGPADAWKIGALFSYGPRWPWAALLLLTIPIAVVGGRPAIAPFAAAAVLTLGPLLNTCVPWQRLASRQPLQLRVVTCNMQARKDPEVFRRLLRTQPDVLALQECYSVHIDPVLPEGWYTQKLEGLLLASRFPIHIQDVVRDQFPTGAVLYALQIDGQAVSLINLQMPSPQSGLRSLVEGDAGFVSMHQTRSEQMRCAQAVNRLIDQTTEPLIIVGDFNATTNCGVYRKCWSRFANAFGRAGIGWGATKCTHYFGLSFGTRIDHVLTRGGWRCHRCWVAEDVGSDHFPLVADLSLDLAGSESVRYGDCPCAPAVGQLSPDVVQTTIAMVVPHKTNPRPSDHSPPSGDHGDENQPRTSQVYARYLQDDIGDFFTNLRAAHLMHLPKDIGQQSIEWSPSDARDVVRVLANSGGAWRPLPESLANKILRQAMVDTTGDRRPLVWSEEEIRCQHLSMRQIESLHDTVTLELSGDALLSTDVDPLRADRGYALRLYGALEIRTADWTFQHINLLGLGEFWDDETRTRGTGDGRPVLAIAIDE